MLYLHSSLKRANAYLYRAATAVGFFPLLMIFFLLTSRATGNAQGSLGPPEFVFATNNGALSLTQYNGTNAEVVVPNMKYGLPVTAIIGREAQFSGPVIYLSVFPHFVTSISIPGSITNIHSAVFAQFLIQLREIIVDPSNSFYSSVDGVLFDKGNGTLIRVPPTLGPIYKVPNSVTNIAGNAFLICTGLNEVYFRGDAPHVNEYAFSGSGTVIYYLPNTSGWGATFADRPTALWRPEVLSSNATFGVVTNQFGFDISWASGMTVVVEASTNLSNLNWTSLQTNILTADSFYFSDPQWANYPMRFYRLSSQ
jgi:hypothetical protein